ncbi:MAG: hypothetical protein A3K03_02765 [Bdellovibrionales bacterium RIFOXYD1_FULL_44_7]|nr:MAG: hypothetical protein A3K03_02765 [Bdellovibrionales bacterium RIFOXYD1_FULL_44_7]
MIEGNGFFPVQTANGEIAYSRNGAFHLDAQARLMLASGAQMIPQVTIPTNAQSVTVSTSGEIKAVLPGQGEAVLGQIQLVTFANDQGLTALGDGLYRPSLASGQPVQGIPGENGIGRIQQGALEGSNVNVANSMVEMITTQRAYEMNTKVMGTADQMLGVTANIK